MSTAAKSPVYALVGNPNCGKSTLFNALTGLKQKVGNYPGVTVERKIGTAFTQHGQPLTLIDLPGTYSLAARSPDEAVTRDVLLGRRTDTAMPDRIICVVDATNLERNLYLVHQILDLGRPVILVLNMMDVAEEAGLKIHTSRLEHTLGIPVIACAASSGRGLIELKLAMSRPDLPLSRHAWDVPAAIAPAVSELQASLQDSDKKQPLIARAEALLLLTDQDSVRVAGSTPLSPRTQEILGSWEKRWAADGTDWAAALVNARYDNIGRLTADIVGASSAPAGPSTSDRIDAWVTHPVWGWCIFGVLMGVMFLSIFILASYPMDMIDGWMSSLSGWVTDHMAEGDLRDLITEGAIAGVTGVIIFLPQILILFLFIGLLESTGYMARAAFIMDRLMSKVGLNGRSFIPLLGSYACAIPGIMAARTIEQPKDRLVTILVAPFMSCSARLPVYLLLIAALVPNEQVPVGLKVGIMLLMYALGTFGAFGFAWLFKKTLLRGAPPLMIMELPPYRLPKGRDVALQMVERGGVFVKRAGTIILGLSIVLWFLVTYPKSPEGTSKQESLAHSYAGTAGHALEPAIAPLGFEWRIGIGLIQSFAAREVFNSSMSVIFAVEQTDDEDADRGHLRDALRAAERPDGTKLFTPLICLNLMVFYVFAMQCISTIAVVKRETNSWKWPLFQLGYMTGFAWFICLVIYQVGHALGY
ncbi:ferrous iron transport protein B [Rariglobus hedericola]|uniref:Ferrous iron transport protein B n=1 Tax=Rariglobus hedericola TaxID=2597822 RepID=A0A556QSQ4_9BACT|nr:ferrous iron transport protein B [Rariglobus hedericola]TSJ79670.1 ferrous iron transport protein B [Rariglobus hedericola]